MLVQAGRRPGDPGLGREADARGLDEPGPGRDVRAVCVRGAMRRLDTPAGRQSASTVIRADVALLDIASMHPTSIENLQLFGPYTKRYSELKKAKPAIRFIEKIKRKNAEDISASFVVIPQSKE